MDCIVTWVGNCTGIINLTLRSANLLIPDISIQSFISPLILSCITDCLSGCIGVLNAIIQPAVNQLNDLATQATTMAGKG
jgi:hypothetical protein